MASGCQNVGLDLVVVAVCHRAHTYTSRGETERDRESEKSPPRVDGHATIPSPPFSSEDLGHARTRTWREFELPGPGLKPWSATWESSDTAITLTAGPVLCLNDCE